MKTPDFSFLNGESADVAQALLGCILERTLDGETVRVKIVETEAYHQSDAASHSYNGQTPRTDVMFGPAGHLYVYFTYGMHYCCNIVTGGVGVGAGVLIRAVEPLNGEEVMYRNRPFTGVGLTNGPAKLCQALRITKEFNGHDLTTEPITLIPQPPLRPSEITTTPRIGISQAVDMPWRFFITDNPYVSKAPRQK